MFAQFEAHLAGGDLLHVQQVVDQMAQAQAVAVGDFQHLLHGRRRLAERATDDQPQRSADRGQRCTQLVADGGDEVVLHLLDALAFGQVHQRAADALGHALRVALDVAAQQHRHDMAVLVLQAQLGGEVVDVGEHRLRQSGFLLGKILGDGHPLPQLEVAGQLVGAIAEHFPCAGRGVHAAGFQVQVPEPVVAALERQRQTFLAQPQVVPALPDMPRHFLGQGLGAAVTQRQ